MPYSRYETVDMKLVETSANLRRSAGSTVTVPDDPALSIIARSWKETCATLKPLYATSQASDMMTLIRLATLLPLATCMGVLLVELSAEVVVLNRASVSVLLLPSRRGVPLGLLVSLASFLLSSASSARAGLLLLPLRSTCCSTANGCAVRSCCSSCPAMLMVSVLIVALKEKGAGWVCWRGFHCCAAAWPVLEPRPDW
ncbi:hypothetical protein COO60DRAFT_1151716 [Scenedesmus sp. NREL 46B-D3]|nr:hypothetical protein COO60DRAFT_1151716 [Scenedesmus sp. NREL 46B-D3]